MTRRRRIVLGLAGGFVITGAMDGDEIDVDGFDVGGDIDLGRKYMAEIIDELQFED